LPQEVNSNTLNFTNHTAVINSVFTPALGVADLADVQVLATVPSLIGTAEGVTIDTAGNIYIVAENGLAPQLFVLSPNDNTPPIAVQVPMMPWWLLMLFASVVSIIVHRKAR